jgi:hypothetical protein
MHIKINTENDAFQGGNGRAEIARILRELADKIEAGESPRTILDVNGNTVGRIYPLI